MFFCPQKVEVFFLCSPDCPKQPRTSFPFYKLFYPIISAKVSEFTLLFCNSLSQAEQHIEKCKKVLSIVNQISLLGRGYRTLNSIPFKKELRIYYYNQGKKTQVEIQGYHH